MHATISQLLGREPLHGEGVAAGVEKDDGHSHRPDLALVVVLTVPARLGRHVLRSHAEVGELVHLRADGAEVEQDDALHRVSVGRERQVLS